VGRAAGGLTNAPLFPSLVDRVFHLGVLGVSFGAQLSRPAGDGRVELVFVFAG
jgi:hypothetical protein